MFCSELSTRLARNLAKSTLKCSHFSTQRKNHLWEIHFYEVKGWMNFKVKEYDQNQYAVIKSRNVSKHFSLISCGTGACVFVWTGAITHQPTDEATFEPN